MLSRCHCPPKHLQVGSPTKKSSREVFLRSTNGVIAIALDIRQWYQDDYWKYPDFLGLMSHPTTDPAREPELVDKKTSSCDASQLDHM